MHNSKCNEGRTPRKKKKWKQSWNEEKTKGDRDVVVRFKEKKKPVSVSKENVRGDWDGMIARLLLQTFNQQQKKDVIRRKVDTENCEISMKKNDDGSLQIDSGAS